MARLPALVDAIAQHDRRGRPTIAHIARQVRNAGLIESTKRGAGASVMTFADAATLLLATCGDISPNGAERAVKNLRSLRPSWLVNYRRIQSRLPPELQPFAGGWSFSELVELMIERAPALEALVSRYAHDPLEGTFGKLRASLFSRAADKRMADIPIPPTVRRVRIVVHVPGLLAEVHIGRLGSTPDPLAFHEYFAPNWVWQQLAPNTLPHDLVLPDNCLVSIEVGLPTLLALHRAVAG